MQALVVGLYVIHTGVELERALSANHDLYLLPISFDFVPVVYAALTFGFEGALPTGLLCVGLALPNVVVFHHGAERIGVLSQLLLVLILGLIVAARVDREQRAKEAAETANQQLLAAQDATEAYLAHAIRAQEEERQRLSRELHDTTIQELLIVRNAVRDTTAPDARLAAVEALDTSIAGVRDICRALRPSVLDDLGLVPALDSLVGEMRTRSKMEVSLRTDGSSVRLPEALELPVFRIAQEALRNTEQHSGAKRADVTLRHADGAVRLWISDNGHGFTAEQVADVSLGIRGMRERARLIDADLSIASSAEGTVVELVVPDPAETSRFEGVPMPPVQSRSSHDA